MLCRLWLWWLRRVGGVSIAGMLVLMLMRSLMGWEGLCERPSSYNIVNINHMELLKKQG